MYRVNNKGGGSSETSSGNATPREDLLGLPSKVTEGDTVDCPDPSMIHPLSPSHIPAHTIEDKNIPIEGTMVPADVPLAINNGNVVNHPELQQHGICLTSSDLDRIKIFVHEFCVRALLPYVERQIRYVKFIESIYLVFKYFFKLNFLL